MSDLHLDFKKMDLEATPFDRDSVLILAGDLGEQSTGISFVKYASKRVRHVIWLMGNHEYYAGDINKTVYKLKEHFLLDSNVSVVEKETIEIDDTTFICATMWTDYAGANPNYMNRAVNVMADYMWITEDGSRITPDTILAKYNDHAGYIENELRAVNPAGSTVVVTHHAPSSASINEKFMGADFNELYHASLEDLMFDEDNCPDVWIHGHMHDTVDYTMGGTRVIANPRGYCRNYADEPENPVFDPNFIIEV